MSKYTAGKWDVGWGNGICGSRAGWDIGLLDKDEVLIPIRSGNKAVAWVVYSKDYESDSCPNADALIISKATEMYELLKEIEYAMNSDFVLCSVVELKEKLGNLLKELEARK